MTESKSKSSKPDYRRVAKRLTSRVIRKLQRLTDCRLSGDDSVLNNTWDEICVQVQFEESIFWDVYVKTAYAILTGEVACLPAREREALWLETEFGSDWACDEGADMTRCPVCDDDIVAYLWRDYVLPEADRWSNKRIRAYLELSIRSD